jgi:hypothetical protein
LTRIDRPNDALTYLRIAHKLEKAPARRQQIGSVITNVRLQLRRQQLNDARQPILHEALEQDRVVRPKVLNRAVQPAKTAAKKGVMQ